MKKLTLNEIRPLQEYESVRKEFQSRMIQLKKIRRLPLGELITMVFENRDTLAFQVQEMMRVEHIYDEAKIQEEINTYNALIPGIGELSATLFIEITEEVKIKEVLHQLHGIDDGASVLLELGPEKINAVFEEGHSNAKKLSAVHYARFPFSANQVNAFQNMKIHAAVRVDHPNYHACTPVSEDLRKSLIQDLLESQDPDPETA